MTASFQFKKSSATQLTISIETANPTVHIEIRTGPGANEEAFKAAVQLAWVAAKEINPDEALSAFKQLNDALTDRNAVAA